MSDDPAPRYVLSSSVDATAVLRRLARSGWQTREGFALPDSSWDVTSSRLVGTQCQTSSPASDSTLSIVATSSR